MPFMVIRSIKNLLFGLECYRDQPVLRRSPTDGRDAMSMVVDAGDVGRGLSQPIEGQSPDSNTSLPVEAVDVVKLPIRTMSGEEGYPDPMASLRNHDAINSDVESPRSVEPAAMNESIQDLVEFDPESSPSFKSMSVAPGGEEGSPPVTPTSQTSAINGSLVADSRVEYGTNSSSSLSSVYMSIASDGDPERFSASLENQPDSMDWEEKIINFRASLDKLLQDDYTEEMAVEYITDRASSSRSVHPSLDSLENSIIILISSFLVDPTSRSNTDLSTAFEDIVSVSLTSRRLHDVVHSSEAQHLWGKVLDLDEHSPTLFESILKRSGNGPIHLASRFPYGIEEQDKRRRVWELALEEFHRCTQLHILLDDSHKQDRRPWPLFFTVPAPELRICSISLDSSLEELGSEVEDDNSDSSPMQTLLVDPTQAPQSHPLLFVIPPLIFQGYAPRLKTLRLLRLPTPNIALGISSASLRHITALTAVNTAEYGAARVDLSSLPQWLKALGNLRSLTELRIVNAIQTPIFMDPEGPCDGCNLLPTSFPHLRRLTFIGNGKVCSQLLRYIEVGYECKFLLDLKMDSLPRAYSQMELVPRSWTVEETNNLIDQFVNLLATTSLGNPFYQADFTIGLRSLGLHAKNTLFSCQISFNVDFGFEFSADWFRGMVLKRLCRPDSPIPSIRNCGLTVNSTSLDVYMVECMRTLLSSMNQVQQLYIDVWALKLLNFTVLQRPVCLYDQDRGILVNKRVKIFRRLETIFVPVNFFLPKEGEHPSILWNYLVWRLENGIPLHCLVVHDPYGDSENVVDRIVIPKALRDAGEFTIYRAVDLSSFEELDGIVAPWGSEDLADVDLSGEFSLYRNC